jgi:hypothetical protein
MKKKIPRRYRYKNKKNTHHKLSEGQIRKNFTGAYGISEQVLVDVENKMSMGWKYTITGRPYLEVVDDKRAAV